MGQKDGLLLPSLSLIELENSVAKDGITISIQKLIKINGLLINNGYYI